MPSVHAVIHTSTCAGALLPVVGELEARGWEASFSALTRFELASELRALGRRAARTPLGLLRWAARRGPKVLLVAADFAHPAHAAGRQAVHFARALHIPSVAVQHGVILDPWHPGGKGYATFSADVMAVWGAVFRDLLVAEGVAAERLVVTGNPRDDALPGLNREAARRDIARHLGLEEGPPVALVAMHLHDHPLPKAELIAMLEGAFRTLKSRGLAIAVRPHPAERKRGTLGWYQEAADGAGARIFLESVSCAGPSLARWLGAAAVVITQTSSVGLQAAVLGTPTLALLPPGTVPSGRHLADGEVYRLVEASADAMGEAVDKALGDVLGRSFEPGLHAARVAYALDGRSAARVADLVAERATRWNSVR